MAFWNKAGSVAVQALLENQFKEFKQELKADLDRMEERLGKRIDKVEERLDAHEKECAKRHGENKELKGLVVTLLALAKAAQGDRLETLPEN